MSREDAETVALAKVFPLGEMIASRGYDYDGPFIVNRPDYFKKLDEIYTDENAEGLRDLVLVRYLPNSSGDLDKETYDKGNELVNSYFGTSGAVPDDEMASKVDGFDYDRFFGLFQGQCTHAAV